MERHPPMPSVKVLLEHADFLHTLSRGLLADEHSAEDTVQETWLSTLTRPPRHSRNLRAWLGLRIRSLAIRARQRARRRTKYEHRAVRPEGIPSVDTVAAQLELQRKVVDAVHALEEPYRSTIVLRFLDGLGPTQIARTQSVSVETVKTRLRRALDQLRLTLDRAHGGQRRNWSAGLLPLALAARSASAAAATGGGSTLLMGGAAVKTKLSILVALCVVGAIVIVLRATSETSPSPRRSGAARDGGGAALQRTADHGDVTPTQPEAPAGEGEHGGTSTSPREPNKDQPPAQVVPVLLGMVDGCVSGARAEVGPQIQRVPAPWTLTTNRAKPQKPSPAPGELDYTRNLEVEV